MGVFSRSKDTKRYYELRIAGKACAVTAYKVSSDFYLYWRAKPASNEPDDDDMGRIAVWDHLMADFDDDLGTWDDFDEHDRESPPPLIGMTPNEDGWPLDPIIDLTAIETKGLTLRIREVKGEHVDGIHQKSIYEPIKGAPEQSINLRDLRRPAEAGWPTKAGVAPVREVAIERDARSPTTPVVVEKIWGEAQGIRAIVACDDTLDIHKISFETWNLDGDEIVSAVLYDGKRLPNYVPRQTPGGDDGRSYNYIGNLVDDKADLQGKDWYDTAAFEHDHHIKPSGVERSGLKGFWSFWIAPVFSRYLFVIAVLLGYYLYEHWDQIAAYFQRSF